MARNLGSYRFAEETSSLFTKLSFISKTEAAEAGTEHVHTVNCHPDTFSPYFPEEDDFSTKTKTKIVSKHTWHGTLLMTLLQTLLIRRAYAYGIT